MISLRLVMKRFYSILFFVSLSTSLHLHNGHQNHDQNVFSEHAMREENLIYNHEVPYVHAKNLDSFKIKRQADEIIKAKLKAEQALNTTKGLDSIIQNLKAIWELILQTIKLILPRLKLQIENADIISDLEQRIKAIDDGEEVKERVLGIVKKLVDTLKITKNVILKGDDSKNIDKNQVKYDTKPNNVTPDEQSKTINGIDLNKTDKTKLKADEIEKQEIVIRNENNIAVSRDIVDVRTEESKLKDSLSNGIEENKDNDDKEKTNIILNKQTPEPNIHVENDSISDKIPIQNIPQDPIVNERKSITELENFKHERVSVSDDNEKSRNGRYIANLKDIDSDEINNLENNIMENKDNIIQKYKRHAITNNKKGHKDRKFLADAKLIILDPAKKLIRKGVNEINSDQNDIERKRRQIPLLEKGLPVIPALQNVKDLLSETLNKVLDNLKHPAQTQESINDNDTDENKIK